MNERQDIQIKAWNVGQSDDRAFGRRKWIGVTATSLRDSRVKREVLFIGTAALAILALA
ncbi:hypothetical protein [Consotaella salsifontis]|uniref:hypothetical protein n=1 Tax=Consotaella salsifontis TaxID=1365950 RepID=UPI0013F5C2BA|nr:hypothetical protein [Consotaella salsifontis]